MIDKYIVDKLEAKVTLPWNHKVACYYGCLLVRPHDILKFDRIENPQSMDIIIKKLGATPIYWAFKTECCGAGFSISRTDVVGKLSGNIVADATDRGAEAIIVACPMCHSNLDMRRPAINSYLDKKINVPVLYITQAIGLAIGLSEKELGLQRHFVPVKFNKIEEPIINK
jgi:heterodisulfide reductase subunit B